jgi:type I restriction enzyme S subunit
MKNWVTKKLGEVYDVRDGTHDSPKYVKEGYALITSKNLKNDNLNYDNVNYITEVDYLNINKRSKVDVGDVLFAMIGTIGNPIVIKNEPDFAIKNVALFKVPKNQDSYFLKYYLDSGFVIEQMTKDAKGATQKFVGLGYLRNFEILLPPHHEQQRIVAILDEAFAAIAKAKANAEQNLKNAKELFESYLQGVFEKKGEGWEEKTLGEIASFAQGIQVGLELHLTEPKPGYVRFIRIVDYTQNTDDIRYVPDPGEKYFVKEDDIVMIRYGTPGLIGRGKAGVIANNLFKITIETKELSKDFLCLCLSQKHIQTYLSTQGSATMPALNFGQLKTVSICYPSIKEQQTIVQNLEALLTETQKLEAIYQQKINDLEELKKSVLQKAFSGELKIATAVV